MAQTAKNSPAIQETWVWFLGWEDPLKNGMATHSSHGQRSLAGYSPWGCKELDTTEWLTHTHTHTENNLSWLGSWLSHHAPTTQSFTGNCLLTVNTQLSIGASLVAQTVKNPPAMFKTQVRSLGQEDPLEQGNDNPLQYSCLENPMDRKAWRATVHRLQRIEHDLATNTHVYFLIVHLIFMPLLFPQLL